MKLNVLDENGDTIEFECADNWASRWTCEGILRGKTYPFLPFVGDVHIVLDVGANCGAATVHFARHYPDATIHSFEPGSEARSYLERNVAGLTGVVVHREGLHSVDQDARLYMGAGDLGMASVLRREVNLDDSEPIELRAAGGWATEHGIETIDILKLDVEGCEVEVLASLREWIPGMKVLYVEYDSRSARRTIESLMGATHELYTGMLFLDQGECIYLRKDFAELPAATDRLRELLMRALTAPGAGRPGVGQTELSS